MLQRGELQELLLLGTVVLSQLRDVSSRMAPGGGQIPQLLSVHVTLQRD